MSVGSSRPEPDWRNPWPVTGVAQGPAGESAGADALRGEGYRYVADVEAIDADHDPWQSHLNNAAPPRIFNELSVAYVASNLAPEWPRYLRKEGLAVVVRELHVCYDSEATVDEPFVGATRVVSYQGKAAFVEQALVTAEPGRSVARGWLVQLVLHAGGQPIDWPDWYWERVAVIEGREIPALPRRERARFGPPE